jgi:hypothetical protein
VCNLLAYLCRYAATPSHTQQANTHNTATATAPIFVQECGTLDTPFATYKLEKDIAISDNSYGFVCFDILHMCTPPTPLL